MGIQAVAYIGLGPEAAQVPYDGTPGRAEVWTEAISFSLATLLENQI